MEKIILAGGCFWGVEHYFKQVKGVMSTQVGYVDGAKEKPTYEEVCNGVADHAEAVEIFFDGIEVETILDHFFRIIDPTTLDRQGNDVGHQYRTGIYFSKMSQLERIIKYVTKKQDEYNAPIMVELKPESRFWPAETYHQDYLEKNPRGYCHVDMSLLKPEERK